MKKRWSRRILLILLAVLMLCALVFPASGSSNIYFMAVNENVHEMTTENMPLVVGSTLYVPYTMFSSRVTNINLGVRAQYSASRGVLSVTDGERTVTFDTRRSTAYNESGNAVNAQALVRNSMAYLPVHWLCTYFPTVRYTLTLTPHGILVRVTNDDVVLTDAEFVDAASDMLYENLLRYQNSITEPDPSPSPTATITPDPPPTTSPSPPPTAEPTPTPSACLAFRTGEYAAEAADILEDAGQQGLFLFTSGELIRQDDLVRRLVARGHQVGLALTGSDLDSCLTQLAAGRQLMANIARTPVLIVSADELTDADRQALGNTGCVVWSATHTDDEIPSGALQRGLHPTEMNYLEYTCDRDGLTLLRQTIYLLTGENFILCRTLASTLQ